MRYCIGSDLGGTNIAGGIADLDGKLLLTDSIKTGLPCPASDIATVSRCSAAAWRLPGSGPE